MRNSKVKQGEVKISLHKNFYLIEFIVAACVKKRQSA